MTLGLSNKERQIMFEEQAPYYYTTVYKEQQNLMRNSYDLNVLRKAMLAFTSLQEVHLLAIMMHKDIMLRNLASSFDNWEFIDCKWIPACKHAAETLLAALYDAKSPVTALCSPTMSPQSLILLGPKARQMSLYTWSQLTYLEITFDERPDRSWDTLDTILTGHDNTLAEMFRHCLHATKNLTTLYIRFTPGIPVRLPLKDAFHDFHWPKLRVLGIGSWMLHAEEIIDIVRRHQTTLHGIRLNEIYLLEGSRWKDVVQAVREHVSNIDWVGLHDIGYEGEYVRKQAYIETYSDTSSESEYEYDFDSLSMRSRDSNSSTTASHDAMQSLEGDGARGEGEDVVYGNVFMTASGTGQPGTSQAGGSSSLNSNIFGGNFGNGGGFGMVEEEEDLEDDGQRVTQAKQKHWERWIMGRAHTGEPYNRPL